MSLRWLALLAMAGLGCTPAGPGSAGGHTPPPAADDAVTVTFAGGAAAAEVPVEMAGEMPFVRVRIAGHERPLWFVVDTGAPASFLDRRTAAELGLTVTGGDTVGGVGAGRVPVAFVEGVSFLLPGVTSADHRVRVLDLAGVAEQLGHPFDGFVGHDLLSRVVLTIDPDRRRLVIADPARFRYQGAGEVLPIRFGGKHGKWIYVPAIVEVPGHAPLATELLVDTGSSDEVNHPLLRRSTAPLRQIRAGVGLGAPVTGVAGRLTRVRLGRFELRDVPSSCCAAAEGAEAQLGQGALSRFVATYDYPRRRMILEPGERLGQPF